MRMMSGKYDTESTRLDDAARAGWLYYVAGNTQDEVAKKLSVSRQSAQRLVSLAVSEKLIKVRLDHPIARCMQLADLLKQRHGLLSCEVIPSEPDAPNSTKGLAEAGAAEMERHLKAVDPKIVAVGTGRVLRACVEQLPLMEAPQHRIVSLLGNITSDGSATPYDVAIRMAERINGRYYPMPLPVFAHSADQRKFLQSQEHVQNILELCKHRAGGPDLGRDKHRGRALHGAQHITHPGFGTAVHRGGVDDLAATVKEGPHNLGQFGQ